MAKSTTKSTKKTPGDAPAAPRSRAAAPRRAPRKNSAPEAADATSGSGIDPEAIAQRAYEIFLARGGHHGADFDDWLEAEQQLKAEAEAQLKAELK